MTHRRRSRRSWTADGAAIRNGYPGIREPAEERSGYANALEQAPTRSGTPPRDQVHVTRDNRASLGRRGPLRYDPAPGPRVKGSGVARRIKAKYNVVFRRFSSQQGSAGRVTGHMHFSLEGHATCIACHSRTELPLASERPVPPPPEPEPSPPTPVPEPEPAPKPEPEPVS